MIAVEVSLDKFEEWWKVNGAKYDYVLPASRDAFESGQQSRQAEVDEKDKRIEELEQIICSHLDERFLNAEWALRGEDE